MRESYLIMSKVISIAVEGLFQLLEGKQTLKQSFYKINCCLLSVFCLFVFCICFCFFSKQPRKKLRMWPFFYLLLFPGNIQRKILNQKSCKLPPFPFIGMGAHLLPTAIHRKSKTSKLPEKMCLWFCPQVIRNNETSDQS